MRRISFSYVAMNNDINYHVLDYADHLDHMHNEIEIVRVEEGRIWIWNDFVMYDLVAGDMMVILPNNIHHLSPDPVKTVISKVMFKPTLLSQFLPIMYLTCKRPVIKREHIHADVRYCWDALDRSFQDTEEENPRTLEGYLYLILARLLEHMEMQEPTKNMDKYFIKQVLVYVNENFSKQLTVRDVARHTGASEYQISSLFNDRMHLGFRDYLNSLRIEYAELMLMRSMKSITEIAFESGFESLRNFNRVFKKSNGITPSEYRQKISQIIFR